MLKVDDKDTRTTQITGVIYNCRSGVFIVNFEHI